MNKYELAQLNIAKLVAPLDSPALVDFVANLEGINSLADNAPGFVWRLQTEEGDATGITDFGTEFIVNMSTWIDIQSLHNFVYRTGHIEVMRRRREWFSHMKDAYSVLWWVQAGYQPSVEEAREKLKLLRRMGPTQDAFTFKHAFQAPTANESDPEVSHFDDACLAT